VPLRVNPLKLNALQLKTLALLQALAELPELAAPADADGGVALRGLPNPHGDHFHIGDAVVHTSDATGLFNPSVYGALARKGLVRQTPDGRPVLTAPGREYPTGIAGSILHRADH
jgi:ribosomal protein S19E (S16A)